MSDYRTELQFKLGPNISTDPDILLSYNHDLAEMPELLLRLFRRTPDAVVVPRGEEDVRVVMRVAHAQRVPVTPRGQASSGYGGVMPAKGGIVLDLARMDRILAVDQEACTVDVEPGVIWNNLSKALGRHGMENRLCPTSGPSSTVGGWFCMGGVGIGSMMYGSIEDVVSEIDVVEPGGALKTLRGSAARPYCQSGGCLGVVTRLRLLCRKREELRHLAVAFCDARGIGDFLLSSRTLRPYSANVFSFDYLRMQALAEGRRGPQERGFLVCLTFFASDMDQQAIERLARCRGGEILDEAVAAQEWEQRFQPMRIKRNGPTLLTGECFISCHKFHKFWKWLRCLLPLDHVGIEAFAVRDGRLAVLAYVPDTSKGVLALLRMGKAMVPLHLAKVFGGSVYAPGLWFSAQARNTFGEYRLQQMRLMKRSVDPKNIMNPGKTCGNGLSFLPFALLSRLLWIGTLLAAPLSAAFPARPRRTARKEAR